MDEIINREETMATGTVSQNIEISKLIYVIRGKQVMIDSDLAMLYQVDTGRLNEAVKRNILRFPENFRFQLFKEEYDDLISQFAISKKVNEISGRGGRRKLPYVFTEQGIAMLSAVLRSETAINVSIRIMETFVEMRKYMANVSLMYNKINTMEVRHLAFEEKTDARFEQVFDYITSHEESNQKIFFDGQIFDAFNLLTDIVSHAQKEIVLIDGYVDVITLNILAKKNPGVDVLVYTLPNAKITSQDVINFNAQYPMLTVKRTPVFHDRFLIIDTMEGYHIGASLKDAGKKCFGINKIEGADDIKDIIKKARQTGT